MTDEGAPQSNTNLTDDEILKRADMINEARKLEQIEKERQIEAEKAQRAAEAERIKKEIEAENAAKIAEANRIKAEEEAKKAEELRRAHELVDAEKASKPKKKHTVAKIVVAIIVLLIVVAGIGILTCTITSTPASSTVPLPYHTEYTFWLNQGTTNIAGLSLTLVGDATQMMATIPGSSTPQTLTQGQSLYVGPYTITLGLFGGAWKVYEITGKAEMKYMGVTADNLVTFDTLFDTDKQIPETLFNIILSFAGIKHS